MQTVRGRFNGQSIDLLEQVQASPQSHVLIIFLDGEMERAAMRLDRQGGGTPLHPPDRYLESTRQAMASASTKARRVRPFTVGEVMTEHVVTVNSRMASIDAMHLMAQEGITSVLVEPGAAGDWGIMTIRDVLERIVRANRSSDQVAVGELASRPLITVEGDMSLQACSELMVERKIRRAVVMKDNKPVGIISETDIFRVVEQHGWEPTMTRASREE
jgi:CBS domain-containing protein